MTTFPKFLRISLLLLWVVQAHAMFGIQPDGHLDQGNLREAYKTGDFEKVRASLENFRKNGLDNAIREDQIFTNKYLAVIYAADSTTINRAESYFNLVLEIAPNIELADMFVSRRVQDIFDRVKNDFERNRKYTSQFDQFGNAIKSLPPETVKPATTAIPNSPKIKEEKSASRKWLWIGTTLVAVGAGTGLYLLSQSSNSSTTDTTIVVDGRN